MRHNNFFDQILGQIEAGHAQDAILQLAGMLDATCNNMDALKVVRAELVAHPLHHLLLQEPLCNWAASRPGDGELTAQLLAQSVPEHTSSTGRHLALAMSQLGIMRALREHHARVSQLIQRNWRSGKRIALVSSPDLSQYPAYQGQDISNIERFCQRGFLANATRCFDLILMPLMSDLLGPDALPAFFSRFPAHLKDGGCVHFATRVPHHLGSGWLAVLLGLPPARHTEADLGQLAADHGLRINSFRDATDCLIWSELSLPHSTRPGGEKEWTVHQH